MVPVIAIIGRANVGKSTLFNQLTRSRQALVMDLPGVTRDRLYGEGRFKDDRFIVIDTGGLTVVKTDLEVKMADQSWQAIQEADILFFMVDGRAGCLADDQALAEKIRLQQKPIYLLVNKTDGIDPQVATADFFALGLGDPVPLAASHGRGIQPLMQKVWGSIKQNSEQSDPESQPIADSSADHLSAGIKIALVGRPNVGKSTLVNRLLGQNRVVVLDEPGTTRDSIYIPFERHGHLYTLIDTAGVRRRARVQETLEKFSVVKTLQAVETCDVVVMVLDAREGITDQDLHLLGFVLETGRSLIIAINKWDNLALEQRDRVKRSLRFRLSFVEFAKVHFISALHGTGVGLLLNSVQAAYHAATKELPTAQLNQVLAKTLQEHAPPMVMGRRIKLRYAHTGGHRPPLIIIHGNQTEQVPESYKRYLINAFRKAFHLVGTPVRIEFKSSQNPFKGRVNKLTPRQLKKRKRGQAFGKK